MDITVALKATEELEDQFDMLRLEEGISPFNVTDNLDIIKTKLDNINTILLDLWSKTR